jgi:hypothetical protein
MIATHKRHFRIRTVGVFLSVLTLLGNAGIAYAGFGITPPYVNNSRLTRGTVYQQRIELVRSDPTEDLTTTITMNVPGAENWISVDRGTEFTMPKGVTDVPITITVTVPGNAEFKEYRGAIRVRTSSSNVPANGGVSIALGAQINVDLTVVDKIYDFNVRQIRVTDLEEGRTKYGLFFPGKIRFFMTIENTGNTDFGPTKVHFDIYDSNQETLLESIDNTNNIEKVPPFGIKEVLAELPTRLPAGSYVVKYTIYKNADIAQQNTLNLSIAAIGAVAGYEGYGFDGLSLPDKLKVIAAFAIPLVLLIGIVLALVSRRNRRRRR